MSIFDRHHKVKEAAAILGVESQTVWRWIRSGKIRFTRLPNGQYRIPDEELARILRTTGEKDGK